MRFLYRVALAALIATIPQLGVHAAAAEDHCSRETLAVRGTDVTVSYCLAAPPQRVGSQELALDVDGSYSSSGGSFSRRATLHFVSGEGPSRVLQNVELAPLGLSGTLHLTLVYSGGLIRIESALLTPGAVIVK